MPDEFNAEIAQVVRGRTGLTPSPELVELAVARRELPPRPRREATTMVSEIVAGLRLVTRDSYMRVLALFSATGNLALTGRQTLEVVFLVRVGGVNSGTVGLLLAVIGVGGVCGALCTGVVIRRLGSARGLIVCACATTPFGLLIPLTGSGPRLALFAVGGTVVSAGFVVTNVIARSFRQSYCPTELLGRITASVQALARGVIPLGALLAGVLGTVHGPCGGLWIATTTLVVAALLLFLGPIRRHRDFPHEPGFTHAVMQGCAAPLGRPGACSSTHQSNGCSIDELR